MLLMTALLVLTTLAIRIALVLPATRTAALTIRIGVRPVLVWTVLLTGLRSAVRLRIVLAR